ncbi:aldo/keto reductase [Brevibacillus fulvus]|uniref:Aryl-alcohol dehydrogenase-like predicted oxidoreductase n=1 Tax=Brevibacillus fulvus TaxID=1125967 RepID=A0A939BSH4_9BACL|nr:aldo/keto reductase [Brevibacillus fulvus]MBM7590717.1 aryl-alcohol dehydrogenase-like predicted oxidoreductase [Brevibacillus fulvus]
MKQRTVFALISAGQRPFHFADIGQQLHVRQDFINDFVKIANIFNRFVQYSTDNVNLTIVSLIAGFMNAKGLSRKHMMQGIEHSLRRLRTDYIDFYFVHDFDENTPIEETLRTLDDLQRQGKILYPAVSNWAAWQIATALGISAKERLARFELIQPMYNLVKRQAEVEILPLAARQQLGVISYSPLGAGLLTGKYGVNKRPEQGRLVDEKRYADRYLDERNFVVADRFTKHAAERGIKPSTLAVAWVMSNPLITAPIIGARDLQQLEDSLAAVEVEMTPEWRNEISSLSVTPQPATDRSEVLKGWR